MFSVCGFSTVSTCHCHSGDAHGTALLRNHRKAEIAEVHWTRRETVAGRSSCIRHGRGSRSSSLWLHRQPFQRRFSAILFGEPDFSKLFQQLCLHLVFCPTGPGWRQRQRHFYPQVPFPRRHGPADGQWDHPPWWHPGCERPPDDGTGRAGDPRCPHLPHWGSPLTSGC